MSKYKEAGVNIEAATHAVDLMKSAVRATFTENVLADVGSFGGLFALNDLPAQPVLVSSTDSVGTKVKLAAQLEHWHTIGHDIVNHCVNDILVQNARPLFFLDYVAADKLIPEMVADVVTGIAEACQAVGCVLIGGETAEMPGVYCDGEFDLVGTVVGLVDRTQIYPQPEQMQAGDLLIGLPSSGPHTNGYSLIRKVVAEKNLDEIWGEEGETLADLLMAPHRCYLPEVNALQAVSIPLKGLAHITGGGFIDNIPRILPDTLSAQIMLSDRQIPPLFHHLQSWSGMARSEAFQVLNMGMGMIIVVSPEDEQSIRSAVPDASVVGCLVTRESRQPRVQV